MHKFEFASKKVRLEFPNGDYTITVDGLMRSRSVAVSMWMQKEAERTAAVMNNTPANEIEKIYKDITAALCKYIDEFLGEGAHEKILGERLNGAAMSIYADVCDVMGYILGSVREAWEELYAVKRAADEK